MEKPNILFVFTDQQRWDALGCTGNWVKTPYLDRIANEGVLFLNCFTNAPVCIPARFSLATGLYPHNTGVRRNQPFTLPTSAKTWMQAVRENGYRTSLFGKCHLHAAGPHRDYRKQEHLLNAYGFDDVDETPGPENAARIMSHMSESWKAKALLDAFRRDLRERKKSAIAIVRPSPLPFEDFYDTYIARRAVSYLRTYTRPQPWFCWVGFAGPHEPWDAPEPYASGYTPQQMPPAIPLSSMHLSGGRRRPSGWLDKKISQQGGRVRAELSKRIRANYAAKISLIDDLFGEILEVIAARGEMNRTVIAFASDHGEMAGDFGLLSKSNMLDPAVRVPFFIRLAGSASTELQGRTITDPVELIDIGPTLAETAGGVIRYKQFGKSLLPVLLNGNQRHRADALVEHRHEIMIANSSWKMTLNSHGKPYLLFDRERDPHECVNLAGFERYRHIEQQLTERIQERVAQSSVDDGARGQRVTRTYSRTP